MFYGIYKNVRDSAWRCLIDFNIDCLPVDVLKITRNSDNIHVIKNSLVNELKEGENGKAYCNGNKWIIIYDDTNPIEISRFTIAHELGHIFLGHNLVYLKYSKTQEFAKRPQSEQQADMFALRLLCPACVLKELSISSAEDILFYCKVPMPWASARYKRMSKLYKRNKFDTSELEKQVHNNFKEYIEKNRPLGR